MTMCNPTEHNFSHGGSIEDDDFEAWVLCVNCGALVMVPLEPTQGVTIFPPHGPTDKE
ncbi:MAG: hypothetical protein WCB99_14435 [Candidatus Cybelea sp.]